MVFTMEKSEEDLSNKRCPVCDEGVQGEFIERHVNVCLDKQDAKQIGVGGSVKCMLGCEAIVPLSEWESHNQMHQLEAEEVALEMDRQDQERQSEAAARASQHAFFAPLELGQGKAHLKYKEYRHGGAHQRLVDPHCTAAARGGAENGGSSDELQDPPVAILREENRRQAPEGIMELLRRALEADCKGICRATLSGYVDHYESRRRDDLGWGCGWRNIQMLCSNLMENPETRKAMFAANGTVPEIASLQKWLEEAWKKGFDVMGAEQLGWKVRDTQKWIGTTECAALLRSFGLRARIADFRASHVKSKKDFRGSDQPAKRPRTESVPPSEITGGNQGAEQGQHAVHNGVECDRCGMNPIRGPRYKSTVKDNYDLCEQCKEASDEQERQKNPINRLHLYRKIDTPHTEADKSEGAQKGGGAGSSSRTESSVAHMRLIEWVWKYFTSSVGAHGETEADGAFTRSSEHVIMSNRPPLYFQHEGHSRTIVGIERRQAKADGPEEGFLLILDPSQKTSELVEALRQKKGWQRLVKRGVHTLRKPEYQLCFVEPGIATGEELEKLKVLDSVLHQY